MQLINELMSIREAAAKPKYGMIAIPNGSALDYDEFESTQVFTDPKAFLQALAERFDQMYAGEEALPSGNSWNEFIDHPEWDEFVEQVWVVQNFFQ